MTPHDGSARGTQRRTDLVLAWVLSLACAGSAVAACSGDDKPDGSATGGGGGAIGDGGGLNFGGSTPGIDTLVIEPASATVTIVDRTAPVAQLFSAVFAGSPISNNVVWKLDTYAQGDISPAGEFTTTGLVGGRVKVTATLGDKQATAELTVHVELAEDVLAGAADPGVSPPNRTALMAAPEPDPGDAATPPDPSRILYPYDKTVVPRGIKAPLLQLSPGNLPPEDAKVTLSSPYFTYDGYIHVGNGATPQLSIPQDIWDSALLSAGGETVHIDVTKAAGGHAYGPAKTSVIVAPGSLKGAVYYMTYEAPRNGLYSVRPGANTPANLLIQGCVVCHALSANGTRLAVGTDGQQTDQGGVYSVGGDGTLTQIARAPAGLAGDSRGLSFATFTPDGKYVLRSRNDFWGGLNELAWKVDEVQGALNPATVVGLGAEVSALVPTISSDGKHYAFTNGPGEPAAFGTVGRSISLMDLDVDEANDTLTFSNRSLLVDNGPGGSVTKFANFLPDPNLVVLQEGENYTQGFNEMLPTWGPNSSFDTSTGRIHMVNAATREHLELAKLNTGIVESDRQRNYEPFALPVAAGGYFWVVFTSIREYGNTYTGRSVRKQLWVAAISTNPAPGEDPSHPAFYLPNQTDTRNERGSWALDPCKSDGVSCETGDDCCNGFCRPEDSSDPRSPRVCTPPAAGGCAEVAERCADDGDCCGAATGTRCVGGFCTPDSPR